MNNFVFFNKVKIFAGCLFFSGLIFGSGDCAFEAMPVKDATTLSEYRYESLIGVLNVIKNACDDAVNFFNNSLAEQGMTKQKLIRELKRRYKGIFYFLGNDLFNGLQDDESNAEQFFVDKINNFNRLSKINYENSRPVPNNRHSYIKVRGNADINNQRNNERRRAADEALQALKSLKQTRDRVLAQLPNETTNTDI